MGRANMHRILRLGCVRDAGLFQKDGGVGCWALGFSEEGTGSWISEFLRIRLWVLFASLRPATGVLRIYRRRRGSVSFRILANPATQMVS